MPGLKRFTAGLNDNPAAGPGPRICLMENHDQAYLVWRDAGLRDQVVVHLDAHDDLWWIPDQQSTNIANFICPALRESIVREVYWVVPDRTWESARTLKPLIRRLQKIIKSYPENSTTLEVGATQISLAIWDRPVRVCTLKHLPAFRDEVLLDIDVDFLTIPWACHPEAPPAALPWCWPRELVDRVRATGLVSRLITIAYSVEGGYTPLRWKYLGDELALRLMQEPLDTGQLRGLELMQAAALAAHQGEKVLAAQRYTEAAGLIPHFAAPHFHLAHLRLEMGRKEEARERYNRALALDPSYRTAYSSAGPWYYWERRYREAEGVFQRTLSLDPQDPFAHLGLGQIAFKRKQLNEAEDWLRRSLALKEDLLDAHRGLGEVLSRQGRYREAIAAYERSLKLALAGHQPLTGAIASKTEEPRLMDPQHFLIHGRLARLYAREGETGRAINSYRLSLAKGGDGVGPRLRLARLYLQQGDWRKAGGELRQAGKMIPGDLGNAGRRLWQRGRRCWRRAWNLSFGN